MAEGQPITFTITFLTSFGARLIDHADSITDFRKHEMERDLRTASRVCNALCGLRFRVAEIAELALEQDGAVTRRDLLQSLTDAKV
jgi:hypothetical protein